MFRSALALTLLSILCGVPANSEPRDYTDELIRLTQLTDNKQYRDAVNGYRRLQAQPATPAWLRAASEYEIAELHGALQDANGAIGTLDRAVQLGFDDCITPQSSERLKIVFRNPVATQLLAAMKITEADFRELVWLKSEVEHAEHDARMMITENINRIDQQATEIPQARIPTTPTTSPAVLYWRQLLLMMQRAQRDYVRKSDEERMVHAAQMAITAGSASPSAVLESARNARVTAESRKAEIRKRDFVPPTRSSDAPRPCTEWK